MSDYEIIGEGDAGGPDDQQEERRYLQLQKVTKLAEEVHEANESDEDQVYRQRKSKLYSEVWTKFTIVNRKHSIASCNICGAKLSFKTTTSNLKKHVERKHNYDITKSCILSYQPKHKRKPTERSKLTDLGGLEGLILNVVADEGEDPTVEIVEQEIEQSGVREKTHDYCTVGDDEQGDRSAAPKDPKTNNRIENMKRNRIMDLQLECLEIKKYNMQMETLLLERQLNLPRSIYTENLRGCDNITRGTQTDVGGGNTKVFYVTDNSGSGSMERSQHLFTFQAKLHE